MTNYLRPDELAAESEIRKAKTRTHEARSALETVGSLGTAALGTKIASKILPMLSQYIPEDLALKGINKISPQLGSFLKNGMAQGLSLKSGIDFLKKSMQQAGAQGTEQPKENRNIIQQYSDELHSFITDQIQKGKNALEAGILAHLQPKFKSIMGQIEKDHKQPISSILEMTYGNAQKPQQTSQGQPEMASQAQPGQGQQALMAILQKIQQQRGGK